MLLAKGEDVVWLGPNLVIGIHYWAYSAFQKKAYADCERFYRLILRIKPDDAMALGNLRTVERLLHPAART